MPNDPAPRPAEMAGPTVDEDDVAPPTATLPASADVEQLRRWAKQWLRRARDGDAEALVQLRRYHPQGAELAADPGRVRLADAHLAIARARNFPSWPKLRAHLELVRPIRRNPHRVPEQSDPADELVRLACLTYGGDSRLRPARAVTMLEADPGLAGATIWAAAATASLADLRRLLAEDPGAVGTEGGPHRWPPLLYACYTRIPDAPPERSSLDCVRLLLDFGADPNAGYLWEGFTPPFTALTGAFGGGENRHHQPPHQHGAALARLLLDAGAEPNDGQTLYNRMFEASDEHLDLLFAHGLGRGDGGPWRRRLGARQQSPAEMLADQLVWAAQADRPGRVALLLEHGVDPNGPGTGHPTHRDQTAYAWALRTGSSAVAELLRAAGARPVELDAVDRVMAAALAGDVATVRSADPELLAQARQREPDGVREAVHLRRPAAVRLLVEAGWDPHGIALVTPLHLAAHDGDLALVRTLVEVGADPDRDSGSSPRTPLGWAEHEGHEAVAAYLRSVSAPR